MAKGISLAVFIFLSALAISAASDQFYRHEESRPDDPRLLNQPLNIHSYVHSNNDRGIIQNNGHRRQRGESNLSQNERGYRNDDAISDNERIDSNYNNNNNREYENSGRNLNERTDSNINSPQYSRGSNRDNSETASSGDPSGRADSNRYNDEEKSRDNVNKTVTKSTKGSRNESAGPSSPKSVPEQVIKEIQDNVVAIKKPIVSSVTYVGNSQCENVKSLLGFTYRQLDSSEVNLQEMKIHVKSYSGVKIYDIGKAAQFIPMDMRSERKPDRIVLFIHGFTDDPSKASFQNISDSFLESQRNYTVAALDGSPLIKSLYLRSTTYVRFIGEKLGNTLAAIYNEGQDPKKITIVGHSLGSHIAGFTGKTFQRLTGVKLGRISGLDPAGPCFADIDTNLRLDKNDADFVDAIHTDGGVFGLYEDVGHVDFYPNGGDKQPDCFFETCSHSRAWLYYSESVKDPTAFPARKCKSRRDFENDSCGYIDKAYMGFSTPSDVRGRYFLQTKGESPFGKGEAGLTFDGSKPAAQKVIDAGSDVVNGVINVADKLIG